MSLTLSHNKAPLSGPGIWCLSAHLLASDKYQAALRACLQAFWTSHPVGPGYTHAQRWDAMKVEVKNQSANLALLLAKERHSKERALRSALAAADADYAAQPTLQQAQVCKNHRAALQEFHVAQALSAEDNSTLLWQEHGEKGSSWFHRLGNEQHPPTIFTTLKGPPLAAGQAPPVYDFSTTLGREGGANVLADFYAGDRPTGLYASEPCDLAAQEVMLASLDKQLSSAAASAAEGPPAGLTESELTEALHSMPKDTRPGHDGLPYQFYKMFWPELKQQLVEVANEAYACATLPPSMLKGVISMVYKGKGQPVDSAASYRPLTLLCCDYKLLAKVMVKRLTAAADSVVDHTQTAFLPGRWIGDNTLFHVEEAMYLQHSSHSACLLFLDFEKAYDRVDRGWLDKCQGLGVPPPAGHVCTSPL
jgi:Reverse transcriptase (RNA-dependent DNA polymerase)